ncbi:MAG: hypothetical protein WDW38_005692 [Sanguina aurantia]
MASIRGPAATHDSTGNDACDDMEDIMPTGYVTQEAFARYKAQNLDWQKAVQDGATAAVFQLARAVVSCDLLTLEFADYRQSQEKVTRLQFFLDLLVGAVDLPPDDAIADANNDTPCPFPFFNVDSPDNPTTTSPCEPSPADLAALAGLMNFAPYPSQDLDIGSATSPCEPSPADLAAFAGLMDFAPYPSQAWTSAAPPPPANPHPPTWQPSLA